MRAVGRDLQPAVEDSGCQPHDPSGQCGDMSPRRPSRLGMAAQQRAGPLPDSGTLRLVGAGHSVMSNDRVTRSPTLSLVRRRGRPDPAIWRSPSPDHRDLRVARCHHTAARGCPPLVCDLCGYGSSRRVAAGQRPLISRFLTPVTGTGFGTNVRHGHGGGGCHGDAV